VDFVMQSTLKPMAFIHLKTQQKQPLDYFQGQTCHAVAGIGKPSKFFSTLTDLDIHLICHPFKDHHAFVAQDLNFKETHPILMTAKDCVKCTPFIDENMWVLQVEAQLDEDFLQQLDAKL
jgi:tetraacyldisaccharide 4'-kinase